MANEDPLLKEVDQDLAEERQWEMFRKHGPAVIGAAAAVVVGVGAWQFWTARQDADAKRLALEFKAAVETLADDEAAGRQAMAAIAEESAGGYGVLSRFYRAASFGQAGERDAAINAYKQIYNDNAAPRQLRELARIRAAYFALDSGRDAVLEHLADLAETGGAYSYHANEIAGIAALEEQDYETALATFRALSIDPAAPASVRSRAEDFAALADAAKAGVKITGEARLEDVLDAVGDGLMDETAPPEDVGPDPDDPAAAAPENPTAGSEPAATGDDAADGASQESGNQQ